MQYQRVPRLLPSSPQHDTSLLPTFTMVLSQHHLSMGYFADASKQRVVCSLTLAAELYTYICQSRLSQVCRRPETCDAELASLVMNCVSSNCSRDSNGLCMQCIEITKSKRSYILQLDDVWNDLLAAAPRRDHSTP